MFNLIGADLFKMCKSGVIKVLFVMTTLCATAMTVIAYLITKGQLDIGTSGIGFLFSDVNIISLLGAVVAGVFISGDFDNKTTHSAIACGVSRGNIIISKSIVFFCAVGFILLPYAVATVVVLSTGTAIDMGLVGVGFLNLIVREAGATLSAGMFLKLLAVMLTLMIVYMAQLSICVPLALVLKKPVLVVAIYYAVTILGAQLVGLRESYPTFDKIYALTPYGGNHSFVTLETGAGDIFKAIAVSLVFIIFILIVTYGFFRKSDVN